MPTLLLALLALIAPALADDTLATPIAVAKVGVGLPGLPGVSAEVFVRPDVTVEAGGGTGLLGGYGQLAGWWRPCWRCERRGFDASFGVGPQVTFIPKGEYDITALIATVGVQPAIGWRFSDRFGLDLGLAFGVGKEWDWRNGAPRETLPGDVANVFSLWVGVTL